MHHEASRIMNTIKLACKLEDFVFPSVVSQGLVVTRELCINPLRTVASHGASADFLETSLWFLLLDSFHSP